jgi:hypothetical protein
VMVLPTWAKVGAMSAGVGAASMVSGVDAAVAVRVRAGVLSANVNSTDDAAVGGFAPMTTATVVALTCVHDAAAVRELTVAPTLAVHAKAGDEVGAGRGDGAANVGVVPRRWAQCQRAWEQQAWSAASTLRWQ